MRYMGFVRTAALLLEQQRQNKEAAESNKDQQVPESDSTVREEATDSVKEQVCMSRYYLLIFSGRGNCI